MKKFIIKFRNSFITVKNKILIAWLFFFCLSQVGQTPYTTFELVIISGLFSLCIYSFIISVIILIQSEGHA